MQTSFEFFLHAPAHLEQSDLEGFLREVGGVAIALGFEPCFTSEMAHADAEKILFRDLTAGQPFRNDVFSGGVRI